MQFLKSDEKCDSKHKVKMTCREKSYEALCAWDNILQTCTGVGLKHYMDPRFNDVKRNIVQPVWSPPEQPADRDYLWIVQDRCSANLTPLTYMTNVMGCTVSYVGYVGVVLPEYLEKMLSFLQGKKPVEEGALPSGCGEPAL